MHLCSLSIFPESFKTLDDMSKTQTLCAYVASTITFYISPKVKWYEFFLIMWVEEFLFVILLCSQKQSWKAYIFPLIHVKLILGFFLHLRWKTTVLQDGISNICKKLRDPFLLSSHINIFPTFLQIFPTQQDFLCFWHKISSWKIRPTLFEAMSQYQLSYSSLFLCLLSRILCFTLSVNKKWLTLSSFSNMLTSFSYKCVLRFTVKIFMFN